MPDDTSIIKATVNVKIKHFIIKEWAECRYNHTSLTLAKDGDN